MLPPPGTLVPSIIYMALGSCPGRAWSQGRETEHTAPCRANSVTSYFISSESQPCKEQRTLNWGVRLLGGVEEEVRLRKARGLWVECVFLSFLSFGISLQLSPPPLLAASLKHWLLWDECLCPPPQIPLLKT